MRAYIDSLSFPGMHSRRLHPALPPRAVSCLRRLGSVYYTFIAPAHGFATACRFNDSAGERERQRGGGKERGREAGGQRGREGGREGGREAERQREGQVGREGGREGEGKRASRPRSRARHEFIAVAAGFIARERRLIAKTAGFI